MKKKEKLLDELKKDKVKYNLVKEEYEVNIRFVDEAKGMQMIVDSGAPMSIATTKWMDRYLKSMEVKEDEITEKVCNRKFKMGENVYMSNREITLPVRMKTDSDDYIRRTIRVRIVDRKDELFLCGQKT